MIVGVGVCGGRLGVGFGVRRCRSGLLRFWLHPLGSREDLFWEVSISGTRGGETRRGILQCIEAKVNWSKTKVVMRSWLS